MKTILSLLLVLALVPSSAALAHSTKKTMAESAALAKLLPAGVTLDEKTLHWAEVETPKIERLKKLAHAEIPAAAGGSPIHAGLFTVTGDWGPIQAVAAVQDGKLLGLEVVSFTEHEGDMITKPAFLKQFQGLSIQDIQAATLKPIPKEPQATEALRAGLMGLGQVLGGEAPHGHAGHQH